MARLSTHGCWRSHECPHERCVDRPSERTGAIAGAFKVGRNIAGLEDTDLTDTPHIAEALQYRKREG